MGFLSDAFESVGNAIGNVVGGITGAKQAAKGAQAAAETQAGAAAEAARIQAESAEKGIAETQRQFDALVELMQPFVSAGEESLGAQRALLGLGGPEAEQAAIESIRQGPQFQSLVQQGEEAILQNASATGGLRGGNVQGALATFRPSILSDLINSRFQNLSGITQAGQAAAAGQAAGGLNTAQNVSSLLGGQGAALAGGVSQAGAARAGGQLAQGGMVRQTFGDVLDIGNLMASFKPF